MIRSEYNICLRQARAMTVTRTPFILILPSKQGVSWKQRHRSGCTELTKPAEHLLLPPKDLCTKKQACPVSYWTWRPDGPHPASCHTGPGTLASSIPPDPGIVAWHLPMLGILAVDNARMWSSTKDRTLSTFLAAAWIWVWPWWLMYATAMALSDWILIEWPFSLNGQCHRDIKSLTSVGTGFTQTFSRSELYSSQCLPGPLLTVPLQKVIKIFHNGDAKGA